MRSRRRSLVQLESLPASQSRVGHPVTSCRRRGLGTTPRWEEPFSASQGREAEWPTAQNCLRIWPCDSKGIRTSRIGARQAGNAAHTGGGLERVGGPSRQRYGERGMKLNEVQRAALEARDRGWSVIPLAPRSKNQPRVKWARYQQELPSQRDVTR
jgi:hypothetical protein